MTTAIAEFSDCVNRLKDIVLRHKFPKDTHVRLSVLPGYSDMDHLYICVCDTRVHERLSFSNYQGFDLVFLRTKRRWDAHVDDTQDAADVLHDLLANTANNDRIFTPYDKDEFITTMDSAVTILNKIASSRVAPKENAVHLDIESHGENVTVKITDPTKK